jgi:DNA mismatch repair protein MutL
MSDIIHLLPEALANQIAAGEVVQRPASVVKELLENSIDAGATEITLIVKEAGRALIQVIDDGKGMSESDVRMCFERHATSKLRTTEDLFSIRTMGFRGEAMASIAAVAQVELVSKQLEDELGTKLRINGSTVESHEPEVCETGSSISVKNLFFNVPARRNFLKSNAVELKHIIEEFQRVAIAHTEIQFVLMQNDMELFNLPVANLSQRIVSVFGKNYQGQLVAVEEETDHVKITGFVGKPDAAKKSRGDQYFFANNRFIKSPYLNHAVLNAFEGLLQPGTHPFYVLFIDIDPKHIDINVHPTKTEIKFDDERTIYAIMQATVRKGIAIHNVTPSLDFEQDINFGTITTGKRDYDDGNSPFKNWTPPSERTKTTSSFPSSGNSFDETPTIPSFSRPQPTERENHNKQNWASLYDSPLLSEEKNIKPADLGLTFGSTVNQEKQVIQQEPEAIFQLKNSCIVTQTKSGLLLVDQQAAHERVLFEKYLRSLDNKKGMSQQVLFPQHIDLSVGDFQLVMELKEEICELGFLFEEFGKNSIIIQGIPTNVVNEDEKALFEGLIDQYKWNMQELKLSKSENLAQALAKRSSMKKGQKMQKEEMNSLIGQLFGCENPNYTPDGRPTFVILGVETIEQYFTK